MSCPSSSCTCTHRPTSSQSAATCLFLYIRHSRRAQSSFSTAIDSCLGGTITNYMMNDDVRKHFDILIYRQHNPFNDNDAFMYSSKVVTSYLMSCFSRSGHPRHILTFCIFRYVCA